MLLFLAALEQPTVAPTTPDTYAATHDHIARGLRKLLSQFQNDPKQRALLASFLKHVQALEDHANATTTATNITNGSGITLDRIGKLVGRGRNGLSDADYRDALRAQIRINRSSGLPRDMLDVLTLTLHDSSFGIVVREVVNDTMVVRIVGALSFTNAAAVWQNAKATRAAGSRLELVYSCNPVASTFAFAPTLTSSSANPPETSFTLGFGWGGDATKGGAWAAEFST